VQANALFNVSLFNSGMAKGNQGGNGFNVRPPPAAKSNIKPER
jgi:hypothetical protein